MRKLRFSGTILAAGLVAGGIAVSLPTTASSAAGRQQALSRPHARYSLSQLLSGVLFDEGVVGKLIVGTETSTSLSANETTALKSFETALGAANGKKIALELQSGSIIQFAQAVNAIDANVASLATAPLKSGRSVAVARNNLAKAGDLGVACTTASGPDAAGCAQSPGVGPSTLGTSQSVSVAIYKNRMAVAIYNSNWIFIGGSSATVTSGNPNSVAVQKVEANLVKLLHA
jgi:hypothetical protein